MQPVLVNSKPLRILRRAESISNFKKSEEVFETTNYSSSSGIVVCYMDGSGEVITQESFDDPTVHFMFTKVTRLQYPTDFDPLGIGSVVQIYWTRSFERVIRGSHIIVLIEKMEVYKCSIMLRDNIFVTFNSQFSPGVATGINERSITVAFHPNCSPEIRFETMKAHADARTEFELKYKHRENINRMVEVVLVAVPFRVEINGNIDKIPYIVIQKCKDAPGKEGVAVVTKIVRNHFMEANFLHSSATVYFESQSCHSNISEKICVGSLINVLASRTFPTSSYKWYGYDITMCNKYLANAHTQKAFVMENNEILQNYDTLPRETTNARAEFKHGPAIKQAHVLKSKKACNLMKFNSRNAQYKLRHLLLDDCYSNLIPREADATVNSYFVDRYGDMSKVFIEDEEDYEGNAENYEIYKTNMETFKKLGTVPTMKQVTYSDSLQNSIRNYLEPLGLCNTDQLVRTSRPPLLSFPFENPPFKSKKRHNDGEEVDPEEIRSKFASLIDSEGFAINQRIKEHFVLPDTRWKPTDRRYIGINDDLQWVMMATFCPIPEEFGRRPLAGGWWYRRTVPREHPVMIVQKMETKRNIITDCTVSLIIE